MSNDTIPAPPEGVHSDLYPQTAPELDQVRDAITAFDKAVEKARAAEGHALQTVALAELVQHGLSETSRQYLRDYAYHCKPRSDGGLGVGIRDARQLGHLGTLREEAERLIKAKRASMS